MKKRFIGIFAVLTIVSLIFGLLGCASTPKLEDYKKVSFSEFQKIFNDVATTEKRPKQGLGFIVEGYINGNSYLFMDTPNSIYGIPLMPPSFNQSRKNFLNLYGTYNCKKYHEHWQTANYELDNLLERIDKTKKLIIYIGFYLNNNPGMGGIYLKEEWVACIDKIEGLRTPSEIANIEAQKKAEQEATAEAKRKAREQEYKNPVFTGTVASFVREYKENEYSFKAKYEDKIVQLTGVINGFDKGYESFFGISTGRAIYQIKVEGEYCFQFDQSDLPEEVFLRLKKGQSITVVGIVPSGGGGWFGYINGKLDNCRFVK